MGYAASLQRGCPGWNVYSEGHVKKPSPHTLTGGKLKYSPTASVSNRSYTILGTPTADVTLSLRMSFAAGVQNWMKQMKKKIKNSSYLTPYPTMTTYMSAPTKPSMPAKRTYLPHQHDLIPKCGRKKLIRPRISTRKTDVPKREKEANRRFSPVDSCTQSHGKVGRQQGPRSALCPVAAGRGPRVVVLRETK